MPGKIRVSSADLVRNFGYWQEKALNGPVYVTHHKRDRLVLLSVERYSEKSTTSAPAPVSPSHNSDLATEHGALLENIADAYLVLDNNLTVLQVNSRLEAMWKADRQQIIGRNFHDFIPITKANLITQKIKRVLLTRLPETLEFASLVFPGLHLSSRIYPHPQGVALVHTNTTEVMHLRAQLAEVESLKNAIGRHPEIAHAQTDARGRFTYSDDTIRLWTGFDEVTLLNTRISDVVVPDDRRRLNEAIDDVMNAHVPSALTVRLLGRDFAEHEVLMTLAPIMAEQNATGVTIIATMHAREITT